MYTVTVLIVDAVKAYTVADTVHEAASSREELGTKQRKKNK